MTQGIAEAEAKSSAVSILYSHLENPENVEALLDTLFMLIPKYGLVRGNRAAIREMAEELLGEVVLEVLAHGNRYDPGRSRPGTWFNGAALLMIKRKRAELLKLKQREQSFSYPQPDRGTSSENEFFDQFVDPTSGDPELSVEANEQFESLLSLTSESNRELLRWYIVHDFDDARLALRLGITREAARQRISRAIRQLRTILQEQGGTRNG